MCYIARDDTYSIQKIGFLISTYNIYYCNNLAVSLIDSGNCNRYRGLNHVSKLIKIKMELKRYFSLIILSVLLSISPLFTQAQKVRKVVIDAGHGGHDPGAVGKTSKEKDITLSIALKTGKFIEENLPDVEVVYTRKTDVFVELYRRARIANEAKADLFISIHCNANKSTTPYGAETYVMGLHKSDANLAVAQTENASILLEDDYHVKYDGFDPTSPEGYIFFTMLQNAYLDQSLTLASNVQKHFRERVNLFDRGVKQAGFLVLYKTTMPSVLIETGFISNAKEEKILASDEGQTYIASAIFRAVKDYKRVVEKTPLVPDKESVPEKPMVIKDTPASTSKETTPESGTKPSGQLLAQKDASPVPANSELPVIQVADNNTAISSQPSGSNESTNGEVKPYSPNVVFKVQFLVSKILLKPASPELKGLNNVDYYLHNGIYKYTYGNESTLGAANLKVKELNKIGFKDCFVVAFHNDTRITIDEAEKLLGN